MRINIETKWQPKGPPPPKVDQLTADSRLFLYQEKMANAARSFKPRELFTPKPRPTG